ncbi:hypothetical protein Aperf_G00000014611 [Anoplocephala perfoliata]
MSEGWRPEEHTDVEKKIIMMKEETLSTSCGQRFKKGVKDNLFTILTLIGVIIGFAIGFGVGRTKPSEVAVTWIKMIGTLYIRLLQLTILPIIAANIIVVMARMDPKKNGKMGLAAICFVIGFDIISGAIGVIAAVLINPGLIFTTIVFGIAAGAAGEAGKPFIAFFESLGNVVLIVMRWFLQATPVGVCFMVAGSVVGLEDVSGTFQSLGLFMVTVLVALAFHMLLQMIVYVIVSSRNPFRLMWMGFDVFFLSFITTSPLIAIPEMLETCDKYGIKKKISRFVIPFSGALKGDASGVFQAVACVFIAQLTGYNFTPGTYVVIALLTGFGTLAIPMVPSSSIIIIITILSSLGVSTAEVSLLFAVEWFMDRCRSGSIGLGHLFAAGFTHSVAIGRRTEGQNIDDYNDDVDETSRSC